MKDRAPTLAMLAPLALLAWSCRAVGQDPFPNEPGRETLFLVCTQCHSPGKMLSADLSREDWEFIVYDMISRGAPVHQEDIDVLIAYLQRNFATSE